MAITSPVRTSITMPQAPMAVNSSIDLASSSRSTACTRTSSDSRSGSGSSRSRWSKKRSTPAMPWPSTSTPPSTCAATRPCG